MENFTFRLYRIEQPSLTVQIEAIDLDTAILQLYEEFPGWIFCKNDYAPEFDKIMREVEKELKT